MFTKPALVLFAVAALAFARTAKQDVKFDNRYMQTVKLPEIEGFIVGGAEVTPNSIPYQVALFTERSDGTYFCGGSLISPNYVLTAAHCVDQVISIDVILGAHNIFDNSEATQTVITTTTFKAHERYDGNSLKNDIAIISLPSPVELSDVIGLTTLPSLSDVGTSYSGTATVSGWGRTSDSATSINDVLMSVDAPIMEWEECETYYFPNTVTNNNVCIDTANGVSSCNGDSGGPLVLNGVQIGVVSFGAAAGCELGYPAAFTRVANYLDWIAANTDVTISK